MTSIPSRLQAGLAWFTALVTLITTSTLIAAIAEALTSDSSPLLNEPIWIAIGALANETALLGLIFIWTTRTGAPAAVVRPLSLPSPGTLILSLVLIAGLIPWAELSAELVRRALQLEMTSTQIVIVAARHSSSAELVLILISIAVFPAIAEELLFRGFIMPAFSTHSRVAGVLVPSLLFGLMHIEPMQAAGTAVLGIGFGLSRLYSGSLVPPMVAHGLYNATVILATRYTDAPVDYELSVPSLVIGGLLTLGALALLQQKYRGRKTPA